MAEDWEWPEDEGGDVQPAGPEVTDLTDDAGTIVSAVADDAVDAEDNGGLLFSMLSFFGLYEKPNQT